MDITGFMYGRREPAHRTGGHAMANTYADNAFTSRQALDPGLRKAAHFLPRGYALHRGYKVQRALMNLMGSAGRMRNVPVAAVNEPGPVPPPRPPRPPPPGGGVLWNPGGGTIMGHAAQDDKFLRKL